MSRKCIVTIIFLLGVAVILTSMFQQRIINKEVNDIEDVKVKVKVKEYISKELGVSFKYPENLGLVFEPRILGNGEIERTVSSVSVDQVLYLRSSESFSKYQKERLEGFKEESLGMDDLVKGIEVNGEKIDFKKYVFGDGSPSAGCLWAQDSVSYVGKVKSMDMYVEIKTEKTITCDSEKEYIYKTDSERINEALKVLKTIKKN